MFQVSLRPAVIDDAPRIAQIWYTGWRDGHLGNVPEALVALRTRDSFGRRTLDRIPDMTVAQVGDDVVGFIAIVKDEVEHVYVASEYRGKGVASSLIAEAERQVRAAGYRSAWLAVAPGNQRARRFYERSGWQDAGSFHYDAYTDSGPLRILSQRYTKRLTDDTAL